MNFRFVQVLMVLSMLQGYWRLKHIERLMTQEDSFIGEEALARQRGSEIPSYKVFIFLVC